jgi:hypothetical protein
MSEQNDTSSDYAPNVRAQYEAYLFPVHDPRGESKRLTITEQDCLGKLNNYCFGGRQSFGNGFRVLAADGGTGDHTIFLAEQLRNYDASVTSIDISSYSLAICKERGRIRNLNDDDIKRAELLTARASTSPSTPSTRRVPVPHGTGIPPG